MTNELPRIAFLGIGLMGAPMTRNLLDAGFPMTLWNRTASKCEPFRDEASIAMTPAEAVANADVVITMLENGQVVEDVLVHQGAIGALKAGALVIDMSLVQPSLARELAGRAAERGAGFLDAPVSGGTVGAAEARLSIMAGGWGAEVERAGRGLGGLGRGTGLGRAGGGRLGVPGAGLGLWPGVRRPMLSGPGRCLRCWVSVPGSGRSGPGSWPSWRIRRLWGLPLVRCQKPCCWRRRVARILLRCGRRCWVALPVAGFWSCTASG